MVIEDKLQSTEIDKLTVFNDFIDILSLTHMKH